MKPKLEEHWLQLMSSKSLWLKGLYILLFFIISYIAAFVTFFVVIFQFVFNLIYKKPNEHLQQFGQSLSQYACDIVKFMTYNTEQMPFPFKPWPRVKSESNHESRTTEKH